MLISCVNLNNPITWNQNTTDVLINVFHSFYMLIKLGMLIIG